MASRSLLCALLALSSVVTLHAQSDCIAPVVLAPDQGLPLIAGQPVEGQSLETPIYAATVTYRDGLTGQTVPVPVLSQPSGNGGFFIFTPLASGPNNVYTYSLVTTEFQAYGQQACPVTTIAGTFTVDPAPTYAASLKGGYVLALHGVAGSSTGNPQVAELGALVADGKGNITAGELDLSTPVSTVQRQPVTGSYTLGANGQGALTLNTAEGTEQYALSYLQSATGSITITLFETDSLGGFATGTLQPQSIPGVLADSWQLQLSGDGAGSVRVASNGPFTITPGGETQATLDAFVGSTKQLGVALSGVVAGNAVDSFGRLSFTLSPGTETTGEPQNFVGYQVNEHSMQVLSLDPQSSYVVLSGTAHN